MNAFEMKWSAGSGSGPVLVYNDGVGLCNAYFTYNDSMPACPGAKHIGFWNHYWHPFYPHYEILVGGSDNLWYSTPHVWWPETGRTGTRGEIAITRGITSPRSGGMLYLCAGGTSWWKIDASDMAVIT